MKRNFGYGSILLLNIVCAPCEVDVPDENLLCDLPGFKLASRIVTFLCLDQIPRIYDILPFRIRNTVGNDLGFEYQPSICDPIKIISKRISIIITDEDPTGNFLSCHRDQIRIRIRMQPKV